MAYYGVFGTLGQRPPPRRISPTCIRSLKVSFLMHIRRIIASDSHFFRLRSPNALHFPLENRFCKGVLKKNRACGEPNTWISPYKITFTKAVLKKIAPAAGQIPIRKSLLKSRFWKKSRLRRALIQYDVIMISLWRAKFWAKYLENPPLVKSRSGNR